MSDWLNKIKIGLFKIFELNSENKFTINLKSEFKKLNYNIFTIPLINSLTLPSYFLGYRFEESIKNDIYSVKLFIRGLLESKINKNITQPLRDIFKSYHIKKDEFKLKRSCIEIPFDIKNNRLIQAGFGSFFLFSVREDIVISKNAQPASIDRIELIDILKPFSYIEVCFRDKKSYTLKEKGDFININDILSKEEDSYLTLILYGGEGHSIYDLYDYFTLRITYKDGFFRDVIVSSDNLRQHKFDWYGISEEEKNLYSKCYLHNCYISKFRDKRNSESIVHYYGDDFDKIYKFQHNYVYYMSLNAIYIPDIKQGINDDYNYISISVQSDTDFRKYYNTKYWDVIFWYYDYTKGDTCMGAYNLDSLQVKRLKEIYTSFGSSVFNPEIISNLKILTKNIGFNYIFLTLITGGKQYAPHFDNSPPFYDFKFYKETEIEDKSSKLSVVVMEVL